MRIKLLAVLLDLGLVAGCASNPKAVTTPLPTNARDSADANAFRVIADAHAFLQSVENSVTAGKLSMTPAQKTLFNDTVAAYNTAYAVGIAYHNGTNTNATTLNAATATLQTQLQAASSQITVTP